MKIYKVMVSAIKNGEILITKNNLGCIMGGYLQKSKTKKGAIENATSVLNRECRICDYKDYGIKIQSVEKIAI